MFQYVFLWHFLSLINLFLLYDCIFPSERYENDYCEGLQCFYMYQLPFFLSYLQTWVSREISGQILLKLPDSYFRFRSARVRGCFCESIWCQFYCGFSCLIKKNIFKKNKFVTLKASEHQRKNTFILFTYLHLYTHPV